MATILITNDGALFVVSGLPDQELNVISSPTFKALYLGTMASQYGFLCLYGNDAMSAQGAVIQLYPSDGYDSAATRFKVQVIGTDLLIGSSDNPDAIILSDDKDLYVTAGSVVLPTGEYFNFGDILGEGSYGIRDNAGSVQVKDSGGTWRDIKGVAVGGYYFNSTGTDPATELGYGTWTQVAQGQFLVGEV